MHTEAIKSTILDLSEGKCLGIRLQGRLEKEDYDEFIPRLEQVIETHGKARLLLELKGIRGITPAALWEDIKFDVKHIRDIERLAIVGDADWQQWLVSMSKPIISGDAKYFEPKELRAAWAWLKN